MTCLPLSPLVCRWPISIAGWASFVEDRPLSSSLCDYTLTHYMKIFFILCLMEQLLSFHPLCQHLRLWSQPQIIIVICFVLHMHTMHHSIYDCCNLYFSLLTPGMARCLLLALLLNLAISTGWSRLYGLHVQCSRVFLFNSRWCRVS